MDILYYSNYCKHSKLLVSYLAKNNLLNKLNCLCIDNRVRNKMTNQTMLILENGKQVPIPPNVYSVPSLLLVNDHFRVLIGKDILTYFKPKIESQTNQATGFNGEPIGMPISGAGLGGSVVTEKFTFYNMSNEELSASGSGGMRQMHNYTPANQETFTITTPDDTYKSQKLKDDELSNALEQISQQRNVDMNQAKPPLEYMNANTANYSVPAPQAPPPPFIPQNMQQVNPFLTGGPNVQNQNAMAQNYQIQPGVVQQPPGSQMPSWLTSTSTREPPMQNSYAGAQ
jgi:hypothetical protein